MSGKSCTQCSWFVTEKFMCTRIKIGRDGGMKVARPDVGACLYWRPVEPTPNDKTQKDEKQ